MVFLMKSNKRESFINLQRSCGYSGIKDNISHLMAKIDPSMSQMYTNRIWNTMRDIESITSDKNKFHINNIPDLF